MRSEIARAAVDAWGASGAAALKGGQRRLQALERGAAEAEAQAARM